MKHQIEILYNPREAYDSAGVNPAVQSAFSDLMKGISSIKVYMLRAPYIVRILSVTCYSTCYNEIFKERKCPWLTDFPDQTPWDE